MGLLIQSRRSKNRRFDYEPRYYDPKKEQSIKRRMRVQSKVRRGRRSPAGLIYFLIMLAMAIYMYRVL